MQLKMTSHKCNNKLPSISKHHRNTPGKVECSTVDAQCGDITPAAASTNDMIETAD